NSEEVKANTDRSTSPNPKPKTPERYKTPNGRLAISSTHEKDAPIINQERNRPITLWSTISLANKKKLKNAPMLDQKTNQSNPLVIEKLQTGSSPVKSFSHRR
ncbi:Hypothetical predicted protein, partial [Olea europaea subsp. europaea]